MKKFLLIAALAATFASAKAEVFSDIFKLTYKGETITDGQTVVDNTYYDPIGVAYPEYAGRDGADFECKAEIFATNISEEPKRLEFRIQCVNPTAAEFDVEANKLGSASLCYFNESGEGNCLPNPFVFSSEMPTKPVSAEEYMRLDVEQTQFTNLTTPVMIQVDLRVMDDDDVVATSTIYVNFVHNTDVTTGVESIESESNSVYYTLQGVRVAQPQKGQLLIERKGSKVTKRIF